MKKSHTTILFSISVTVTLLVVALFVFSLKIIKNKNQHISVVVSTLEGKIKEKENMTLLSDKVAEIKNIQDIVNNHLVDSSKIDKLVNYLEDIGPVLGSKVSVESIEIPKETKNVILVKVLIVGDFNEVVNTIGYLENIPYEVNISQVYLNKDLNQENLIAPNDPKNKVLSNTTWQANISFNILSLN